MKLSEISSDHKLDEILPALGGVARAVGAGIASAPKVVGNIAKDVGRAMAGNVGQPPRDQETQLDPAQAAQMAKDQQEQKKQIQDAIKQKQQELTDLQKQLAELG